MNAIAQDAVFCIPHRNVAECHRCGRLMRGRLSEVFVGPLAPPILAFLFACRCTPTDNFGALATREGVMIAVMPR